MTEAPPPAATLTLSWDAMHRDACALAARLRTQAPFDGIVAVSRGGLVPAAIVARDLDLTLVETICVTSYDDRTRGTPAVVKPLAADHRRWLVIDDLVDSGATARLVRAMLPGCHYATLYAKPAGLADVDTHLAVLEQRTWVVFPWEAALSAAESP